MGCRPSKRAKRPLSTRSWMVSEGWIESGPSKRMSLIHGRTASGKVLVTDEAGEGNNPLEVTSIASEYGLGSGSVGRMNENIVITNIQHLQPGEHFHDNDFPANASSLFYSAKNDPEVVWKSPKDLVAEPKFFVDGTTRSDIMQGSLGDCWFLSSCAAVCRRKELMEKILPEGQNLCGPEYKGFVRVRFWRYGRWVDVYIDDRLPTRDGQLIYAHCTDPNEFWVSLLEKAYAKLHGSYEALEGGQSMDALVDLTGGIAERYELTQHTQELYTKIARAEAAGAFITCSRKGNWRRHGNEADENGLIAGHAYTVTAVKRIRRINGNECLLRIRNPWGYGEEWKGAWSDKDHRWQLVDEETRRHLQFMDKEDGEFWISFKDFCLHFQEVTICTLGPDFDGDGISDAAGQILVRYGQWELNRSAGGCRNDLQSFSTNPQYLLTVYGPDEHDSTLLPHESPKNTCCVIIALMQGHSRSGKKNIPAKMLQLGFIVYKSATTPPRRLPSDHFTYNYETAKSGTYVNFREICGRFEFEPGHYIVIPSTYGKGEAGEFMLRVFSRKQIALKELPNTESPYEFNEKDALDYGTDIAPPAVTESSPEYHLFDPPNGERLIPGAMDDYGERIPPAGNQRRKQSVSQRLRTSGAIRTS